MSFWKKAAGAIAPAVPLLGSLYTANQNRKAQDRADRRNVRFWEKQNLYNDPSQQMQRLKDAGLNPHLVYGQSAAGAAGNAGAISPTKASDTGSANIGDRTIQGFQTQAQTANINTDTAVKAVKLGVDKQYSADIAREQLNGIQFDNIKKDMENQQLAPFVQTAVMRAAAQLRNDLATARGKQLENVVKQFRANLADKDINPDGNFGMVLFRKIALMLTPSQQQIIIQKYGLDIKPDFNSTEVKYEKF
jgi:hypothetical protein